MNLVYSEAGELDNTVGMPSKKGDLGKFAYLVDEFPDIYFRLFRNGEREIL
jgi:hypothetical protein